FTADSRGKITIGIGPTVTVPASALSGDEYAGAILCTTTRVGGNDTTLSTVTAISFTIGCQELSAQNINGHVDGLAIGHVYTLDPMSELIFPIINGSERGSPIGFNIIADPGQEILLHLTLPQHLIREHGDSLPCAFSKSSLVRLEDSLLVDPDLPHVFNSGTGGSVKLRLGMSITVPKNARGGTYSDSVLWMVLYTGSPAKSAGLRNSCSTESAGYTVYTVRIVTPLPEEYALYQNYPNPFNSTTTIRYNLPDPSMISLKVYDLLGREVATLVSGFQQAGELRTIWDAHEASSGVYLYRFRTASFSDTRKLIISR
ncbi:MAG: T9SS type A sorting domain-containing protein, partial [Ignavibacteria bacterium]|nr:T9SS type A sorting domain-containing protein [Ignavibacteria bacterium]